MPKLPPRYSALYTALEFPDICQPQRPYLGMSGVGNDCARALWYNFRWASGKRCYSKRVQRIFNRGDIEEERILRDLREVGVSIYMLRTDGTKFFPKGIRDEYQEEVAHFTGHSLGHIDGRAINIPGAEKTEHLCEFKTMKDSKFKDYKKNGFTNFPEYDIQKELYMGYLGLTRCLYIVTNKDTEERSYERYHFDKLKFEWAKQRIIEVIGTDTPPSRINENPDYYKCRFCNNRKVCFNLTPVTRNCRTCQNGNIHDEGKWQCGLYKNSPPIPLDIQWTGCQYYALLDTL